MGGGVPVTARGSGVFRPSERSHVDYVCADCRGLNLSMPVVETDVAGGKLDVVFCAWCKHRHFYWTSVRPLEPDQLEAALNGAR